MALPITIPFFANFLSAVSNTHCQMQLTSSLLDLADVSNNVPLLLRVRHFACSRKDELTPTFTERVGLAHDFYNLGFKLLFSDRETSEGVISNGAFVD